MTDLECLITVGEWLVITFWSNPVLSANHQLLFHRGPKLLVNTREPSWVKTCFCMHVKKIFVFFTIWQILVTILTNKKNINFYLLFTRKFCVNSQFPVALFDRQSLFSSHALSFSDNPTVETSEDMGNKYCEKWPPQHTNPFRHQLG